MQYRATQQDPEQGVAVHAQGLGHYCAGAADTGADNILVSGESIGAPLTPSVIPALQLCLGLPPSNGAYRGPSVLIITTTVDQANQCHKRASSRRASS